jgi:hypothetical protein
MRNTFFNSHIGTNVSKVARDDWGKKRKGRNGGRSINTVA